MPSLAYDRSRLALKMLFPKKMSEAADRRARNIQIIIRGLIEDDLTAEEIHGLLECSMSGVQKYLRQMKAVGLIQVWSESLSKGTCVTRYRLYADAMLVEKILAWEPNTCELLIEIKLGEDNVPDAVVPKKLPSAIKVSRDPLVEALFGPPRLGQ